VANAYALARTVPEISQAGVVLLDWTADVEGVDRGPEPSLLPAGDVIATHRSCTVALGGRPPDRLEVPIAQIPPMVSAAGGSEPTPNTALVGVVGPTTSVNELVEARHHGVREFNVSHNLLYPLSPETLHAYEADPGDRLYVRDAFAGQRLLGASSPIHLRQTMGPVGPIPLGDLERYWAPVTRLSFLTDRRQRTLAQAAVGYVVQTVPRSIVLLDLDGPERLEEVLSAVDRPPLSAEELVRVAELTHNVPK
jgi:hypothetical protein